MPVLCHFLGISIFMNYRDHNPPHFHAKYQDFEAVIDIKQNRIINGQLPPRVLSLVVEWCEIHKRELLENWQKAENRQPLSKIEPLV